MTIAGTALQMGFWRTKKSHPYFFQFQFIAWRVCERHFEVSVCQNKTVAMSFDANIIDNTDELPVSDNYSSPTGRTFVWPEGDVINCIQRKPDLLWKRCKEMEQIAEMEEHRSKVSGKMNVRVIRIQRLCSLCCTLQFRNVDEQICMDRYSILVVNLPIRVEPLLLAEAVDENMQPYIFEHPYPYAEIIYLRKGISF